MALTLRSRVYASLRDFDRALADYESAHASGMRTADSYFYRGWIRRAAGDVDGMMTEFDEALKLDPHHLGVLRARGRVLYLQQKYPAAEDDFMAVLAVRPDALDSIWLYLTRLQRGDGKPEPLERAKAQLTSDQWPTPVLEYLLDRIDRDALMKAAAADEKERKGRECEARFYAAERLLISGKKDDARPLFEAARDGCPTGYVEYMAALSEIERIK